MTAIASVVSMRSSSPSAIEFNSLRARKTGKGHSSPRASTCCIPLTAPDGIAALNHGVELSALPCLSLTRDDLRSDLADIGLSRAC